MLLCLQMHATVRCTSKLLTEFMYYNLSISVFFGKVLLLSALLMMGILKQLCTRLFNIIKVSKKQILSCSSNLFCWKIIGLLSSKFPSLPCMIDDLFFQLVVLRHHLLSSPLILDYFQL